MVSLYVREVKEEKRVYPKGGRKPLKVVNDRQNYDKISGLTRNAVKPKALAPISDAARQYIICVHYSIRE